MNNVSISDIPSIISGLSDAVHSVSEYVRQLSNEQFSFSPPDKWNAGQQLDHLIRSIKPLNLAYALPGAVLKLRFGVANRPSKTYAGLVEKYESKLAGGGKASGRFIPETVPYESKDKLCSKYEKEKEKLNKKISRMEEDDLDRYILPHPLLGMLTLREMLFFTIHHNYHHLNLMKTYLTKSKISL
jgi:hypothetical protein